MLFYKNKMIFFSSIFYLVFFYLFFTLLTGDTDFYSSSSFYIIFFLYYLFIRLISFIGMSSGLPVWWTKGFVYSILNLYFSNFYGFFEKFLFFKNVHHMYRFYFIFFFIWNFYIFLLFFLLYSHMVRLFFFDLIHSISFAFASTDEDDLHRSVERTISIYNKEAVSRVNTPLLILGFSTMTAATLYKVKPSFFSPFLSSLKNKTNPLTNEYFDFMTGVGLALTSGYGVAWGHDYIVGFLMSDSSFFDYSQYYFSPNAEYNHGISEKRALRAVKDEVVSFCEMCRNSSNPDDYMSFYFKYPKEVQKEYFELFLKSYQEAKNNYKKE